MLTIDFCYLERYVSTKCRAKLDVLTNDYEECFMFIMFDRFLILFEEIVAIRNNFSNAYLVSTCIAIDVLVALVWNLET